MSGPEPTARIQAGDEVMSESGTARKAHLQPGELAEAYLAALRRADIDAVLGLFRDGAMVHSPLYGPIPAVEFYPRLFADTSESRLALSGVAGGVSQDGAPLVFIWFHFDWRLPTGRPAAFDVVDIAELTDDGQIAALHIVYDTVDARPAFEADTSRASWRASRLS